MELIFAPFAVMVGKPWIAAIVGSGFAWMYGARHRRFAAWMALAWAAYCAYEYLMKYRVLCSGECNIRVDLLVIYPVLALGTVLAIWQSVRALPPAAT